MSQNDTFLKAAAASIKEAQITRDHLAGGLAVQFIKGDSGFDAKSLARLDQNGLAAFLETVGARTGVHRGDHATTPPSTHPPRNLTAKRIGWSKLRRKEPNSTLLALAIALQFGVGSAVVGALLLMVHGY